MRKRLWVDLLALALTAAACALPASLQPATPGATPDVDQASGVPEAALKAQIDLAEDLDVPVDNVSIQAFQASQWGDSCLELPQPGEACTQEAIPGWNITLESGESLYVYHSDETGATLRRVQGVVDPGPIALQSVQLLAGLMGYNPQAVQIISETQTTFQDTCLGLITPGMTCQFIPVRGEVVRLEANDMVFELRSQNSPIDPVVAEIQGVSTTAAAITWTRLADASEQCSNLVVYPNSVVIHYDCSEASGREPGITNLTPQQQSQLLRWFVDVQTFEYTQGIANGASARLYFSGIGRTPPTTAEQQQIFQYTDGLIQDLFLSQPTPESLHFGP